MIIYFYLFIPVLCRLAESSSIKGKNHKNDLVPFLSSRLDTQKDNSLKIVSNEPFIIQFQMPPQSKEHVHNGARVKDKKQNRTDKKRISKIKPLKKKMRKRRDVLEAESREEKSDQSMKLTTDVQTNQNKTQNFLSRQEILKALNTHLPKKETKKLKSEGTKNVKNAGKTDATSSRKLQRNHSPYLPDRDPHVKMIYPNTPKSDSHNYSFKDLISDRERLEQKINYLRNMLNVNDTTAEDAVRIRRKSDSDKTANKIAKMFLTLSAVNGLHDKKPKCRDYDEDRVLDIWEKESKKGSSKQSSSSNEERYKVKKWIEYMKSKRSSGKTCPCMNEYNEENDIFPLEQKLAKGYTLTETGASSEESSDNCRDTLSQSRGRPNKSGLNRNGYKEDTRSKLRALANRGRRKYELPIDDLELYRSRAKQILQNAEEILDKIKEEEEKRLAAPHAIMSRLRELTSRIQGDPRNNENDLINIIQKNLGWAPQSKSQSSTDNNSFMEKMKSLILDPYEKAKVLTDESTKKLSSYLLRNLGKIDSSEEQDEAGEKSDHTSHVFHGQVPQTEGVSSANLAKENPESDSLAKEREEHQNWSETISAVLGGNDEELEQKNAQEAELKQIKDQGDLVKKRMEEIIKEQEKKISGYTEKPDETFKKEEMTVIDLMTGEENETPKAREQPEHDGGVEKNSESGQQDENIQKNGIGDIIQSGVIEKESETAKSTAEETGSDVIASEHQQSSEDQTVNGEFAQPVGKNIDTEGDDDTVRTDFPLELKSVKASIGEDSPKEYGTVVKYLEDYEEVKNAQTGENQEEAAKDVVTGTATEFEKETSAEREQVLESQKNKQDDKVQSKQDREENDVLNTNHLVQEDDQKQVEEIEEFKEDIQKLLEDPKERSEESTRQEMSEEHEGTILKKEYDSSETKNSKENVSEVLDPAVLQKQKETIEETQNEPGSENNPFSTEVIQASQDPKESLQYGNSRTDKLSSEKENSADELVENKTPESPVQSFVESEKTEDSAEDVVEKEENSLGSKSERTDDTSLEKMEATDEEREREDDTLKSALKNKTKKDDRVRVELNNQNDDEEKEILRESSGDVEQDKSYQEESSLKASLDESDDKQKSSETSFQKSLEEDEENLDVSADKSTLQLENPENETFENSSGEMSLKASKHSQEKEVDEKEKDDVSLRASKPENTDEIQATSDEGNLKVSETELDNRENKDDPRLRAEQTEVVESDGGNEELLQKSENPETDSERSNESLMNTSGSQEQIEAAGNETVKLENGETENIESADGSLTAIADEIDDTEKVLSEVEKAEEQEKETETESPVANSREANQNVEENTEVNKKPKLLMSIKKGLEGEIIKANDEEGNDDKGALIGDTVSANEEDDAENGSMDEGVPVRVENPETDQEQFEEMQDSQEMDDGTNVRAENIKNLDTQIDDEGLKDGEELRSAKAESEELNEDDSLREVNSLLRKNLDEDDAVEGVDQMKEVTVGKKKNTPASEEVQNYPQNQSKSILKVPKSIGKIMRDLDGKEKDDYTSLTNLNPEKIDHIIDKIDEAEHRNKLESEDVDCRKECSCADELDSRSRNIGRYEIVKDFLHWVKDLQLNRVLTDD